jgi:O-antigen/teichoic acid export membrane protein
VSERRAAFLTVAGDVAWNLPIVLLTKGKNLLLVIALARVVGLDGLGVWAQANVIATLVLIVSGMGLYQAMVQFYPEADAMERRRLVGSAAVAVAAAVLPWAVVVWSLAPWIGGLLDVTPAMISALEWAGVLGGVMALRFVVLHQLRARAEIKRFSLLSGASELAELLLVVLFAILGGTVGAALAGAVVASVLVILFLSTELWHAGAPLPSWTTFTRMARYALPVTWTQLADALLSRGDRLLVGAFLGSAATGLYSAIYSLVSAPNALSSSLTTVLLPRLASSAWAARGGNEVRRVAVLAYAAVSLTVVVVVALLHQPLLAIVLGAPPAAEQLPALIAVIGLGVSAFGSGKIISLDLFTGRRTLTLALIWTLAAALNLGLNVVLLPGLELLGAAIATLVANVLFIATLWRLARSIAGKVHS